MLSFASGPWAGSCWVLLGQAGERTPRFCAAFLEMQSVMTRSPTDTASLPRSTDWTVQKKITPPQLTPSRPPHFLKHQAEVYPVQYQDLCQFGASQCPRTGCRTVSLTCLWNKSRGLSLRRPTLYLHHFVCFLFISLWTMSLWKLNFKVETENHNEIKGIVHNFFPPLI